MLWKLGGVDGDPMLRGTRIKATWEYVSLVEGGQLGMVSSCVICLDAKNLVSELRMVFIGQEGTI